MVDKWAFPLIFLKNSNHYPYNWRKEADKSFGSIFNLFDLSGLRLISGKRARGDFPPSDGEYPNRRTTGFSPSAAAS
jgi:hypothetical protein